jgi:hypothetical protein
MKTKHEGFTLIGLCAAPERPDIPRARDAWVTLGASIPGGGEPETMGPVQHFQDFQVRPRSSFLGRERRTIRAMPRRTAFNLRTTRRKTAQEALLWNPGG